MHVLIYYFKFYFFINYRAKFAQKKGSISLLDKRADFDIIGRVTDLEKNFTILQEKLTILQEKLTILEENLTTFTEKFSVFEKNYKNDQVNMKIMFFLSQIPIWGMIVLMMQK